ncbi:MAG TPA: hypothetical protein VFD90_04185, partial [Gaiellales bacterium]|nr:hypothetical protein [Gaiellales bacterium]
MLRPVVSVKRGRNVNRRLRRVRAEANRRASEAAGVRPVQRTFSVIAPAAAAEVDRERAPAQLQEAPGDPLAAGRHGDAREPAPAAQSGHAGRQPEPELAQQP